MTKSKSTVLLYSGGSYGTYLHWILYTLTHTAEIFDPTTSKGNSHNLDKLVSVDDYKKVLELELDDVLSMSPKDIPVLTRLHPKRSGDQSLAENINKLLDKIEKLVIVYPSKKSYLLTVNNYYYKIWDDPWTGPLAYVNKEDLYKNFPVDPDTPLSELPVWIVREYLSYNLFGSWENQVEWQFDKVFKNDNCLFVYVDDILNDPIGVANQIKNFMSINWVRDPKEILPYHAKNLSLQKYLNQDELSSNIVKATLSNQHIEWSADSLTLPSEAWIQRSLRNAGYGLKCHGLNQFPIDSTALTSLIYKL